MTKSEYERLENSIESFEFIKQKSEDYWRKSSLQELCWGLQIQKNSTWKKGLTENELKDFQNTLGIEFPQSLKNFYLTMNGLENPGIDIHGGEEKPSFGSTFYSYPDDIKIIQEKLKMAFSNDIEVLGNSTKLFPYFGHRFLDFTGEEKVLSIYYDDIITWSDNLAKGIAKDIFDF